MRVVQILPNMRRAGAETVTSLICSALASAGHEVHLLVVGPTFDYQEELAASPVQVHHLNLLEGDLRFYDLSTRLRMQRRLKKCILSLQPDVVHCHLADALIWASPALCKLSVPKFYTQHGMDSAFQEKGLRAWWLRWQLVHALSITQSRIFAVSPGVRDYLKHWLQLGDDDVTVLPNPVDNRRFFPGPSSIRVPPVILILGTLYSLKRVSVGIRAFECLVDFPSAQLYIAGDGPDRLALETQARRSPVRDRILFLGVQRDTRGLFHKTGVLWTLSAREGCPMVALEAMACGVPIVATNVAGTNDVVVDGENGLLVPLDDAQAVAEATRRVWSVRGLQEHLMAGGLRTAQQHSVEVIAPMLEAHYQRERDAIP